MMTSRLTLLTILLFTFNLQHIQAQDLDTVTISGRVMDQNGAVVPGAEGRKRHRASEGGEPDEHRFPP